MIAIYKFTWQYKDGSRGSGPASNPVGVILQRVEDLRLAKITGSSTTAAGVHNSLSGRSTDTAHPATAITNTPSGNLVATNVQDALNEIQSDVDTRVTLTGAEVITNKDYDGGAASTSVGDVRRITIPKAATATLAALTRKEATLVYDTATKKLNVDDGSSLKVVGGGLIPSPITKDSSSTLENGKHYLYDGSSMAADKTLNLPAITTEANIKITIYNIPVGYKVIIAPNGAEKIFFNDTDQSTVEFIATETEQWAEFISNNVKWIVNDAVGGIGYTLSGPLTVTGDFTPSGGIVGKTDGLAVGTGKVGEIIPFSGSSGITVSGSNTVFGNSSTTGVVTLQPGNYFCTVAGEGVLSDSTVYMLMSTFAISGTAVITNMGIQRLINVTDDTGTLVANYMLISNIRVTATALLGVKCNTLAGGTGTGWSVLNGSAIRIA